MMGVLHVKHVLLVYKEVVTLVVLVVKNIVMDVNYVKVVMLDAVKVQKHAVIVIVAKIVIIVKVVILVMEVVLVVRVVFLVQAHVTVVTPVIVVQVVMDV